MIDNSIALSPEQIAEVHKRLSSMRHNVNNHLSLIVAASELVRRKPEVAPRMIENILLQPERINSEVRDFSEALESMLRATPRSIGNPEHPVAGQVINLPA